MTSPKETSGQDQFDIKKWPELGTVRRFLRKDRVLPLFPNEPHSRLHDDHDGTYDGQLVVSITDNGDMWVTARLPMEPLRFRMPQIGGGMSPYTFNALRILAAGILLDNLEHPVEIPENTKGREKRIAEWAARSVMSVDLLIEDKTITAKDFPNGEADLKTFAELLKALKISCIRRSDPRT